MINKRSKTLVRARIKQSGRYSVRIFLSNKHTYAQIVNPQGIVMTSVSSRAAKTLVSGSNCDAARAVGSLLGKKIVELGVQDNIAYDRSGKKYQGRVAAIADSAREEGVKF